MQKFMIHLVLMAITLVAITSCSTEDSYDSLELEKSLVSVNRGETVEVKILSGNQDYKVQAQDPSIVKTEFRSPDLIVVEGVAEGKTTIVVLDNKTQQTKQIAVEVAIPYVELSMSQLTEIFQKPADQVDIAIKNGFLEKKELSYSTISTYQVSIEGVQTLLTFEQTGKTNISFMLSPIDQTKNQENFSKFMEAAAKVEKSAFIIGFIGKYDEAGELPNTNIQNIRTAEDMAGELNNANWTADWIRAGYKVNANMSIEIRCDKGVETLIFRPKKTHDTWKWYFKFLGQDFNSTLMDHYYQMVSTGMIPPFYQLFIIEGAEKHGNNFNAVFFAQPQAPIERIEMSFKDIANDTEKVKATWLSMIENQNVEQDFGTFEETFIFSKSNEEPIQLPSVAETVAWIKANDISKYSAIMPIFRTGEKNVIVPQIANSSLVVTVGVLEKSSSTQIKNIKKLIK